jgi:hypothetical protein
MLVVTLPGAGFDPDRRPTFTSYKRELRFELFCNPEPANFVSKEFIETCQQQGLKLDLDRVSWAAGSKIAPAHVFAGPVDIVYVLPQRFEKDSRHKPIFTFIQGHDWTVGIRGAPKEAASEYSTSVSSAGLVSPTASSHVKIAVTGGSTIAPSTKPFVTEANTQSLRPSLFSSSSSSSSSSSPSASSTSIPPAPSSSSTIQQPPYYASPSSPSESDRAFASGVLRDAEPPQKNKQCVEEEKKERVASPQQQEEERKKNKHEEEERKRQEKKRKKNMREEEVRKREEEERKRQEEKQQLEEQKKNKREEEVRNREEEERKRLLVRAVGRRPRGRLRLRGDAHRWPPRTQQRKMLLSRD